MKVDFLRSALFLLLIAVIILSSSIVSAAEVRIGIGFALPPYVIPKADGGLEVDIIREALKIAGHKASFQYLPNLRLPVVFAQGEVDGVAANVAYDLDKDAGRKGFKSDETVVFQNYAITMKDDWLVVDSLNDLRDKCVLGFNNARKYLGPAFAELAENNPSYSELADQSLQVRMLFSKRVQVVISDKRIFSWWRAQLYDSAIATTVDFTQPVVFHPVFPPAPRQVTFADKELRDAFNIGLKQLKDSGRFDAIIESYLRPPETW